MIKTLKDLAWNVSEEEYRQDNSLSYSTLARYEKGGFSSIPHLFDKQEGEALTFGSMVDCLLTEGKEKFQEKFTFISIAPTETIAKIIQYLVTINPENSLFKIPDDVLNGACILFNYQPNWKVETKLNKIRTLENDSYYRQLKSASDKTVVDKDMYYAALDTVLAIKSHPYVGKYFGESNDEIEYLYQTKFKHTFDDIKLRCMFDLLIVNHYEKIIIPCDLKTSSLPEYDFAKKYLEYRYDIQSRLYSQILTEIVRQDKYFKDFYIEPFRFIVINKNNKNPLVFSDSNSLKYSRDIELVFKSGRITTLRAPLAIACELQQYLTQNATVPEGISTEHVNDLVNELNKL